MRSRSLSVIALVACGGKQPPQRVPEPPMHVDAGVAQFEPDAADEEATELPPSIPDDEDEGLACEDVIRDLASYPPALPDDAPERDWNLAVRGHIIDEDCEHDWSFEVRSCVANKSPDACAGDFPNELVQRLTKLAELGKQIAATKAKATCAQAVAGHYGAPRWVGKLEGFSTKQRNQMIADSRTLMLKACTDDRWRPATRACFALGAGDLCFFNTGLKHQWGYPADGSVKSLGIPECDDYDAAVLKLAACKEIEDYTREALLRMSAAFKAQIAGLSAAERARRGGSCSTAIVPIQDMIANYGCQP